MRHKILVIDDSRPVHELVRAALADEAVSIGSALDGEMGMDIAIASRPDLILLDVDMPGMDGFEVCRQLHEDLCTKDISVIFLTAMAESRQKVHGLDLGGTDYITKPFDPLEFAARIRAALRNKQTVDSMRSRRVSEFMKCAGHALPKGGAD